MAHLNGEKKKTKRGKLQKVQQRLYQRKERDCWTKGLAKNLENCIELEKSKVKCQVRKNSQVKLERANGGYLGTQRRRRT